MTTEKVIVSDNIAVARVNLPEEEVKKVQEVIDILEKASKSIGLTLSFENVDITLRGKEITIKGI